MDKCLKQNQGYKDTQLSGKNGHVSNSRIRGTWCSLKKRERLKKKNKGNNDSPMVPLIRNMPVRDDKLFKKVKGLDLGV